MTQITIAEAAKMFGLNKKTLMRWDALGKLPSARDLKTNIRYYDKKDIEEQSFWLKLRIKDRNHNRKLTAVRNEADKFSATTPLDGSPRQPYSFEAMKAAYDALKSWTIEHKKIHEEYAQLPVGFIPKVDVSDFENILEELAILEQIRELLSNKDVALDLSGDTVRFSFDIGNDDSWQEVDDVKKYSIEELAAIINNSYLKLTTGQTARDF